jgi:hypothetical protein
MMIDEEAVRALLLRGEMRDDEEERNESRGRRHLFCILHKISLTFIHLFISHFTLQERQHPYRNSIETSPNRDHQPKELQFISICSLHSIKRRH